VIVYVLMNVGAFGMILLLSRAGFEAENLDDFKGLNQRSPWYAFMMLIVMFSLAGLPPAVGFFAKLAVLQAVLDAGYTWLVVYAVLMSVIGAFYYLRVVKVMYMDEPAAPYARVREPIQGLLILLAAVLVSPLGYLLIGPLGSLTDKAAVSDVTFKTEEWLLSEVLADRGETVVLEPSAMRRAVAARARALQSELGLGARKKAAGKA